MSTAADLLNSVSPYVWTEGVKMVTTIVSALVVSFIATFYLKKKDEITRVAGVILEKRVNSTQEILNFLENASFHVEMPRTEADVFFELLIHMDLEQPHGRNIQYAEIFSSTKSFRNFFKGFEEVVTRNKLWLSKNVLQHLYVMQGYFSWINVLAVAVRQAPQPNGKELTRDERERLSDRIMLVIGASLDNEFNGLIAELEVLMVDSVYHLDLKRPRKSVMRNGMLNRDTIRMVRILSKNTLLGRNREKYLTMVMLLIWRTCGMEPSSEDVDSFMKWVEESGGQAV
jgi:hypothetical protein